MSAIYLLALVLVLASITGAVVRKLRQPLVVAYVVTGALLSISGLVHSAQLDFLRFLPEIGLAFLLFLVGMELDLREIRSLGKTVGMVALCQVLFTASALFLFWRTLALPITTQLLLAAVFSFSSTILMVKLLLEGKQLGTLHGKLALGVTIVEDLLALLVLMLLPTIGSGSGFSLLSLLFILVKGLALIFLAFFISHKVLHRVFTSVAENAELLVLTAISWCLVLVSVSVLAGFSIGIGAFIAGVTLGQSIYRIQISGKVKPLRDFFIMIFFINLGVGLFPVANLTWEVPLVLVTYTVIVKPVVFFLIFTALRFRAHTAFRAAVMLSSISEFSLFILFLAKSTGLVDQSIVSSLAMATVVSFMASSFLITHSRCIYRLIGQQLKMLEQAKTVSFDFMPKKVEDYQDHAVLIGCHSSGEIVLNTLKKNFGDNLIVADYNPAVTEKLRQQGVSCVYGDVTDPEVLEMLNLPRAQVVVSTVRDLADNLVLLDTLHRSHSKAVVIITAADIKEALILYEHGAHHVSLPLALEGVSISRLISDHINTWDKLVADRERKWEELKSKNA